MDALKPWHVLLLLSGAGVALTLGVIATLLIVNARRR